MVTDINSEQAQDDDRESEDTYRLFRMTNESTKPLHVKVLVNGKELTMEVDTGASISLVTKETFDNLWQRRKLEKSSIKLQTYTGEYIKVAGSTEVQVEHNGQEACLPLIVIQGKGPSLLEQFFD